MSGYRCVNYYELCRLCTASHGVKTHIFSDEGRKKDLNRKISICLPVVINEQDKLPKIVCAQCLVQVETIAKFRETCINAQTMLESCLNSSKLRNGGKVYIKDVAPKKPPSTVSQNATSMITTSTTSSSPVMTSMPAPPLVRSTYHPKTNTANPNTTDFLSSIIQAVGIQNMDEMADPIQIQQTPQYTITLDGQTIKTNQIHYKIEAAKTPVTEPQQSQTFTTPVSYQNSSLANVDEFLKLKTNPQISATIKKRELHTAVIKMESPKTQSTKTATQTAATPSKKQKINLVITTPPQSKSQPSPLKSNTALVTPHKQQVSLQDLKIISPNKCYLPITLTNKDGSNDQQIVAQIDTKNLVLPTAYLQMKLQPQITTVDGQHVVQLTNLSNSLSIGGNQAPQLRYTAAAQHTLPQHQQSSSAQHILPSAAAAPVSLPTTSETKTLFTTSTGQNVTITHQPLATLTGSTAAQTQLSQPIPSFPQSSTVETSVGKVQLTMLQNVPTTSMAQSLPQKSGITIQRIKTEPIVASQQRTHFPASTIAAIVSMSSPPVSIGAVTVATQKPTTTKTTTSVCAKMRTHPTAVSRRTAIKSEPNTTQSQPTMPKLLNTSAALASTAAVMTTSTSTATTTASGIKSEVPTCDVCEKVFKRKEHLAQHMKLHLGLRPFKCEEPNCNKAFSRKEHLMRHVVSHTGKKMFSCEFCHKLFSRKDNLNKHRRLHTESGSTGTIPPAPSNTGNNGQYICKICNKTFAVKLYYDQHQNQHRQTMTDGDIDGESKQMQTTLKNEKIEIKSEPKDEVSSDTKEKDMPKLSPTMPCPMKLSKSSSAIELQPNSQYPPVSFAFSINSTGVNSSMPIKLSSAMGDSHDTAVLNLPSNFGNIVSLNVAQYNELMGQLKIHQQQQQQQTQQSQQHQHH